MRIWTLDELFRRWPSVWFRIAFESTLPSLAGLVWGAKIIATDGASFAAITAAGIAFTAALYVQGQVLRMAKNVRDESDANEFRNSFATVQQALDELRGRGPAPPPVPALPEPEPTPPPEIAVGETPMEHFRRMAAQSNLGALNSESEFRQADMMLSAGMLKPAVLVSAVAFEKAAREAAERLDIAARLPLHLLIRELSNRRLDNKEIEQLRTLVRLRNGIVHSETKGRVDSEAEAAEIVEAFKNGAGWLKLISEDVRNRQYITS